MGLLTNIVANMLNAIGHPGEYLSPAAPVYKGDRDTPSVVVGDILDDGSVKWEIVAHNNKSNMHIKVIEIRWPHLGTYLDVGKVYPVYKHSSKCLGDGMRIWEISPKRMKRGTSQVLLAWEKGCGWSWDIDS